MNTAFQFEASEIYKQHNKEGKVIGRHQVDFVFYKTGRRWVYFTSGASRALSAGATTPGMMHAHAVAAINRHLGAEDKSKGKGKRNGSK